jgi:hypothetical protein
MRSRLLAVATLLCLLALPVLATAAEQANNKSPAVIVRIQPIDELIANLKALAILAGRTEEANQLDGFVKSLVTDNSLQGVDTKRALGFYSILTEDISASPSFVILPIASQKQFLELLENQGMKAKKDKEGIYSASPPQIPLEVRFRFSNDYIYITALDKTTLSPANILAPASVFSPKDTGTFSATFKLNQIPDNLKQIALQQLDLKSAEMQDRKEPGETESQKKLRAASAKDFAKQVSSVVNDGNQIVLRLNLNPETTITGSATLTAQAGTKLAETIEWIGQKQSRFASMGNEGAALTLTTHMVASADVRKALGPVIDEGIAKVLADEPNEAKRKAAEKVLNELKPTLKAAELDVGFRVTGPDKDGHFTAVGGIKLRNGAKVLATSREMAKTLAKTEQAIVHFDAEKSGDIQIHRIDAQNYYEDDTKRVLGEKPMYFAIVEDALFLAGGPNALTALKEAMAAEGGPVPAFRLEMSLSKLAASMGKDDPAAQKAIVATAKKVFAEKDSDKVILSLRGGKSLRGFFSMKPPVIKFLAEVDKQVREKPAK